MDDHSAETIKRWDREHVWHPFTPMDDYLEGDPVVIEEGEGTRLKDVDGNWYYDGVSSVWLNVHGHRSLRIDQAIRDQLDQIAHSTLLGQGNVPSAVLARRLAELSPEGLEKVFYSDSGATAVEIALKMAIQYWANRGASERKYVLGFTNNYHGDTIGAMGVAPDEKFHGPFMHLLPDHPRAPYPYPYQCPGDTGSPQECLEYCFRELEAILEEKADEIAGIIVEPVEGAGGMVVPPEGFLRGLHERADAYDVLLIADEVATGFGRTGPWFACEHEGIAPDIMCLGKGITGGYAPVAATLATGEIFDTFRGDRSKALYHGHSYTGNQLGCAAAIANLDLLEETIPGLDEKIAVIAEALHGLEAHPFVGDVRQKGFMCGIELTAEKATKARFPEDTRPGYVVSGKAREHGMLIRPIGHTVIFMPSLGATTEELEEMGEILRTAFREAVPELESIARAPADDLE